MATIETKDRLASDLKSGMRDAEEVMKATSGQGGNSISEERGRLSAALESARATYERLQEKTAVAAKATDRVIRDHPYPSLGVAFGVGVLIGFLIGRK